MREAFTGIPYEDFLAEISRKREIADYLEIGVNAGNVLRRVSADRAVGVDPSFCINVDVTENKRLLSLHRCTSDRFFSLETTQKYDMIFLDGMHTFEYTLRDFFNAEKTCKSNSLIILHDCFPLNEEMADRDMAVSYGRGQHTPYAGMWTGDVWKIVPILQQFRPDLRLVCLDCPPTGLLCVTGLDPSSTVLKQNYLKIVDQYKSHHNTIDAIENMYSSVEMVRSANVLNAFDQSCFFVS